MDPSDLDSTIWLNKSDLPSDYFGVSFFRYIAVLIFVRLTLIRTELQLQSTLLEHFDASGQSYSLTVHRVRDHDGHLTSSGAIIMPIKWNQGCFDFVNYEVVGWWHRWHKSLLVSQMQLWHLPIITTSNTWPNLCTSQLGHRRPGLVLSSMSCLKWILQHLLYLHHESNRWHWVYCLLWFNIYRNGRDTTVYVMSIISDGVAQR